MIPIYRPYFHPPIDTFAVPPTLPQLEPDRLQLLVFGPGTGELILVRAPPGDWLVLDGCGTSGERSYALAVLSHYSQQDNVRFIAMTHPHEDHARGVAELVDALTQPERAAGWPRLGMIWPSPLDEAAGGDEQAQLRGARVRQALAAILDRWERRPSCRWELTRGDTRDLGDAKLRVLSPASAVRARFLEALAAGDAAGFDKNRIATAIEVTWRSHRVVLGSDLVEKPGKGWSAVIDFAPEVADHGTAKVAHHGSIRALHEPLLRHTARTGRSFVVTPFATQDLPRFDREGGVARLHEHAATVHLTGLPRGHDAQPGAPLRLKRSQLARRRRDWEPDPVTPGFPDCWIMVELSSTAARRRVVHGIGSVAVGAG
jgi:hypothetical protein